MFLASGPFSKKRFPARAFCVMGMLCLGFQSVLFAEQKENDVGFVRSAERTRAEIEETSAEAKKKSVLQKIENVTYQDILKSPDDILLNFQYAQNQVAQNNLLGAAATLERILLIDPSLARIRLFYAVVLFRLDNWNESRRELEVLLAQEDMPDSLRREIKDYHGRIKRRIRRTHLSLRQSTGFEIDTNRNAAPSSKKRYFGNSLLNVDGTSRRRRDTSLLAITTAEVTHDLGFQEGHQVFGSFTHFLQEQTQIDSLDLQSFQWDTGGVWKPGWFEFTPRFYASNVFLSRETFMRTQGGSFQVSRNLGRRLNVFSESRIERQDFSDITENTSAHERKGNYFELENGGSFILTPSMRVNAGLVYGNKSAKADYNAYERLMIRLGHSWLLPRGQFVINNVDLGRDVYDEPELAIAARLRRDNSIRYRVTYGVPLESAPLGKYLPGPLKDILFTFSYEYYRSLSNITNYTYRNNKFQAMLSKKWEF